jgi:hypothetical protein
MDGQLGGFAVCRPRDDQANGLPNVAVNRDRLWDGDVQVLALDQQRPWRCSLG